jgi:hypothetical protein
MVINSLAHRLNPPAASVSEWWGRSTPKASEWGALVESVVPRPRPLPAASLRYAGAGEKEES